MITQDELNAEWAKLEGLVTPTDDPGLTASEMAGQAGQSSRSMQRTIRSLVASGKLIQGWANRPDSLGRTQRVPVYRKADQ